MSLPEPLPPTPHQGIIPDSNMISLPGHRQSGEQLIRTAVAKDENYIPTSFDILLGKEKSIFNHSGNKQFRLIINCKIKAYIDAPTKSAKTKLIHKIHCEIRRSGYRFLKKDEDTWIEVDRSGAREKVSHALRDRVKGLLKSTRKRQGQINNITNSSLKEILREELECKEQQQLIQGKILSSFDVSLTSHEELNMNPIQILSSSSLTEKNCLQNSETNFFSSQNPLKRKRRLSLLGVSSEIISLKDNSLFSSRLQDQITSNFDQSISSNANKSSSNLQDENENSIAQSLSFSSNENFYDNKMNSSLLGFSRMIIPVKAKRRNGLKLGGKVSEIMTIPSKPKRRLSLICFQQESILSNDKISNKEESLSSSSVEAKTRQLNSLHESMMNHQNKLNTPHSSQYQNMLSSLLGQASKISSSSSQITDNDEIGKMNLSSKRCRRLSLVGLLEEEVGREEMNNEIDCNIEANCSSTNFSSDTPAQHLNMLGLFQDLDNNAKCITNESNDEDYFLRTARTFRQRRRRSSMSTLFFDQGGNDTSLSQQSKIVDCEPLDHTIELNETYLDELFSSNHSSSHLDQ